MRDINFFHPKLNKKIKKSYKKVFSYVMFLILILSIASYSIFAKLKISKLSEKTIELKEIIENTNNLIILKNTKQDNEELKNLKSEIELIKDFEYLLNEKDFINSKYIEAIVSKKPTDLFLTSININTHKTSITGTSDNKLSIAEFGKGLEEIREFENLVISNIKKEAMSYKFVLESNLLEEEESEFIEKGEDPNE